MVENGRRSEDLRYVTQHFTDLQGLRLVPVWALMALTPLVKTACLSELKTIVVMVVPFVILAASFFGMRRWYRWRYGLVMRPAAPVSTGSPWQKRALLVVIGFAVAAWSLHPFDLVEKTYVELLAWIWLSPRCFEPVPGSGVLVMRRVLYTVALLLVTTMSFWDWFGHSSKGVALQGLTISMLILGIYDHWLLDTVLRGSSHGMEVGE